MATLQQLQVLLALIPKDGLRKAAERAGLTAAAAATDKKTMVDALLASLANGTLVGRPLHTDPTAMLTECFACATLPYSCPPDVLPQFNEAMQRDVRAVVAAILADLPVDRIEAICAGKVSSTVAKHPERSALAKRWRDRYGRPSAAYTLMRRVYVDRSGVADHKAREAVALSVEQFVFDLLKERVGEKQIGFSQETGRTIRGDHAPTWSVYVYVAAKLRPASQ